MAPIRLLPQPIKNGIWEQTEHQAGLPVIPASVGRGKPGYRA
jgi:hypothetical protein